MCLSGNLDSVLNECHQVDVHTAALGPACCLSEFFTGILFP